MPGDRPALLGLGLYLMVAAIPTVTFWVALRLVPRAVEALSERSARRRRAPGPSCENVIANLRRLRREMCGRPQATQVRRLALIDAYDETLLQVCRMVEVEAPLAGAPAADRPFARLLTEAALERAGVALDPPGGAAAA